MEINKCPKCKAYFYGTYCATCQQDIKKLKNEETINDLPEGFEALFGGFNGK